MSAYISQHLTFRSISNVQYHRLHQTWSAVLSHTCRNAALYYLPRRLSTWLVFSWGWCQLVFDSTLHHTASFDSNTLSLAAMTSSSRSKASTKGRPQPKHGKKTAVRPSRLFTRRRPTCRATSPESIGRPSPAGSGSVYEPSQEPPEGYTDINNAALKKVLDAHITPFTQLPKMVREELMDSTCPGAVISAGSSMAWNLEPTLAVWPTQFSAAACSSTFPPTPLSGPCPSSTATLSTPIRRTPRYSSLIKQFILVLNTSL
ncbi:hypothetical protein C361_05641 [Cryptococcus neoformans Tu259-1]|uniref:Uncharacterized protein n=1 Tax=Cryptococcus neoformans Tu259-1 TaxID=1230072 RepID=A0A854Q7I9_CRYNE|nr:hypothetical protein C361_05641 [Cryptococcus neoformans var. grubii Tu259-1]